MANLSFEAMHSALKASAEGTRLRILALLAETELTVSDLTEILRQSQPRISRHLKLLAEAGLIERHREGAWAFFRMADRGENAQLGRLLVERLDADDPTLSRDRERLAAVREQRAKQAQDYFRSHAAEWDRIRKLHTADSAVEDAIIMALSDKPFRALLDLGTGTGRMLELFGPQIERGLGIDLSPAMLSIARARLERAGLKHCSVRQGDIYNLPLARESFDVVIIHQVLHYLDDGGRAVRRDPRVCAPAGSIGRARRVGLRRRTPPVDAHAGAAGDVERLEPGVAALDEVFYGMDGFGDERAGAVMKVGGLDGDGRPGVAHQVEVDRLDIEADGVAVASSMGFVVFSLFNIGLGLMSQSETASAFNRAILSDRRQLALVGAAFVLTVLPTQLDFLQGMLGLTGLSGDQWLIALGLTFGLILIDEVVKVFLRRRSRPPESVVPSQPLVAV